MTIRGVVFDIGGVLEITEPINEGPKWASAFGLTVDAYNAVTREIWRGGSLGTLTLDEVHEQLESALETDPETIRALMDDIWNTYLGVANTELIDYARGLRPRYATAILSNSFVGAREREQQAYGFEDLVDFIVYSHEVGLGKPDPKVYELTCDRLGLPPREVVFVDDVQACVDGALAYGMKALRFTTNADVIAELDRLLAEG